MKKFLGEGEKSNPTTNKKQKKVKSKFYNIC